MNLPVNGMEVRNPVVSHSEGQDCVQYRGLRETRLWNRKRKMGYTILKKKVFFAKISANFFFNSRVSFYIKSLLNLKLV